MKAVTIFPILLLLLPVAISDYSDSSNAESNELFSLTLLDSNGNDLSDPLFGDVTVFFDTLNINNYTVFKLKAMLAIKTIPAHLMISSSGGLFKATVKIEGINSFLNDTGIRISLSNSTDTFVADVIKDNTFVEFKNGSNIATLDPNTNYAVSVNLINGYDSSTAPESINNIKITFQAIASEGFHQVVFISQDKTIESFMAFDNYVINEVPSVSRHGYSFLGWFTPDGKEITDGYVISPNDGDIIAIAEWEKEEGSNIILYVGVAGGICAAFLLLLLLLKRRKDDEP